LAGSATPAPPIVPAAAGVPEYLGLMTHSRPESGVSAWAVPVHGYLTHSELLQKRGAVILKPGGLRRHPRQGRTPRGSVPMRVVK